VPEGAKHALSFLLKGGGRLRTSEVPRRVSWAEQIDRERTAAVRRASAELRRQEAEARRRAREAKQAHVETRLEEADEKNEALAVQLTELERLLSDGVSREWSLDLQSLKLPLTAPPFDPRGADYGWCRSGGAPSACVD